MRHLKHLVLTLAAAAVLLGGVARAQVDRTTEAIDRGIAYLLPETEKLVAEIEGGGGGEERDKKNGQLALHVYALLVAGVAHTDPILQRSFEYLKKMGLNYTYGTSCYIFALDAAISQIENDLLMLEPERIQEQFRDNPAVGKEYRPRLEAAVNAMARGQNAEGGWRYHADAKDFDNSNVQFAVLGLGVGAKRRVPIEAEVWKKVVQHFLKWQEKNGAETPLRIELQSEEEWGRKKHEHTVEIVRKDDGGGKEGAPATSRKDPDKKPEKDDRGKTTVAPKPPGEAQEVGPEAIKVFQRGWGYDAGRPGADWNMTCAGLSSLLLARESLRGQLAGDLQIALDKAIRDGYGWVMGHWAFAGNYYGSYSLEKVADIGHVKLFGGHDWYKEVSGWLLGAQQGNGSWPEGGGHGGDHGVNTSFALLILNRATATSLLTMNPAQRVMISGKSSGAENPEDRSWVYVPILDTSVHYPSLLRAIRLRPSPKLLKFLVNIIDNYPEEWKGELIPELARVRDAIPNKAAEKLIDDYLAAITGSKYKDYESYMKWHRRWERVVEIGRQGRKDKAEELLTYYKHTNQSVPLKAMIMWSLVRVKAREALPLFLEDLENKDAKVRFAAYRSFKDFFVDFPPPFDPEANPAVRARQVEEIKGWYSQQKVKVAGTGG
jgi:hypothetical protein